MSMLTLYLQNLGSSAFSGYITNAVFYAKPATTQASMLPVKDPRDTWVLTLDASNFLAAGEQLTSVLSSSVSVLRSTDPNPSAVVPNAPQINPQAITTPLALAAQTCVQSEITGGLTGVWYQIAQTIATSNPQKIITLKAILPVSSS